MEKREECAAAIIPVPRSIIKKGKEITLYRDLESGRILERGPKLSMLTGGIILILISAIGAISTLDVLGIL